MYIAKITFKKPQGSDVDYEKIESLIHSYLIGLERNGNILKLSLPLKATEEVISFQAIIPEADSLKKSKRQKICIPLAVFRLLPYNSVLSAHSVKNSSVIF